MSWFFQRNEKWPTHVGEEYEPNDEEYENNDHAAGGAAKAPQGRLGTPWGAQEGGGARGGGNTGGRPKSKHATIRRERKRRGESGSTRCIFVQYASTLM